MQLGRWVWETPAPGWLHPGKQEGAGKSLPTPAREAGECGRSGDKRSRWRKSAGRGGQAGKPLWFLVKGKIGRLQAQSFDYPPALDIPAAALTICDLGPPPRRGRKVALGGGAVPPRTPSAGGGVAPRRPLHAPDSGMFNRCSPSHGSHLRPLFENNRAGKMKLPLWVRARRAGGSSAGPAGGAGGGRGGGRRSGCSRSTCSSTRTRGPCPPLQPRCPAPRPSVPSPAISPGRARPSRHP